MDGWMDGWMDRGREEEMEGRGVGMKGGSEAMEEQEIIWTCFQSYNRQTRIYLQNNVFSDYGTMVLLIQRTRAWSLG